jgi:hypothetical protein
VWGPSYVCKQSAADLWAKVMAHAIRHDTWSATDNTTQRWGSDGTDWRAGEQCADGSLGAHRLRAGLPHRVLLATPGRAVITPPCHCCMRPSRRVQTGICTHAAQGGYIDRWLRLRATLRKTDAATGAYEPIPTGLPAQADSALCLSRPLGLALPRPRPAPDLPPTRMLPCAASAASTGRAATGAASAGVLPAASAAGRLHGRAATHLPNEAAAARVAPRTAGSSHSAPRACARPGFGFGRFRRARAAEEGREGCVGGWLRGRRRSVPRCSYSGRTRLLFRV